MVKLEPFPGNPLLNQEKAMVMEAVLRGYTTQGQPPLQLFLALWPGDNTCSLYATLSSRVK